MRRLIALIASALYTVRVSRFGAVVGMALWRRWLIGLETCSGNCSDSRSLQLVPDRYGPQFVTSVLACIHAAEIDL